MTHQLQAAAFPYFETWQPARDDLWNLALIMLSASAVLGLMTLEVWIMVGSALSVVAGVGGVFYFCFVGLNGTATSTLISDHLPRISQHSSTSSHARLNSTILSPSTQSVSSSVPCVLDAG